MGAGTRQSSCRAAARRRRVNNSPDNGPAPMLCLNAGKPHASKPNIQDERVDRQGDAVKRVPVRWGLFLALWCGLGSQAAIAAERAAQQAPATKVVHVGNVDLHYIESGSGVPVVFVHGSVDDYRSFEPQIA